MSLMANWHRMHRNRKDMKTVLLFIVITLQFLNPYAKVQAQATIDSFNDGPYLFYVHDSLTATLIENGKEKTYHITTLNFDQLKTDLKLAGNYNELLSVFSAKPDYVQKFESIDSIAAISDVHGQFDAYIGQLRANGIIDAQLNWKFGTGHLVFVGDAMDRGDKVTELLWHLFKLEKQAEKAGGAVHVLLGNHEGMVFYGDLRYIHEKYMNVEQITGKTYLDLYSSNSVLGKWLRSKPVMVSINDIMFVHAGVSTEMVRHKLKIKEVNKLFNNNIYGNKPPLPSDLGKIELITGNNGPLWYRGYFEDKNFGKPQLDSILTFYNVNHIVVGHTTAKQIKNLYNYGIIGIDAGIGYGYTGEMMFYIKNEFYKGSNNRIRTKL